MRFLKSTSTSNIYFQIVNNMGIDSGMEWGKMDKIKIHLCTY